MKKFNFAVVAVWVTLFFCSLFTFSDTASVYEETGIRYLVGNIVVEFNNRVQANCNWCVQPEGKVLVETSLDSNNQSVYTMLDYYNSRSDTRMTMTILRNTFPLLLFVVFVLNIAFYAGKASGDGSWQRLKAKAMKDLRLYYGYKRNAWQNWRRRREQQSNRNALENES